MALGIQQYTDYPLYMSSRPVQCYYRSTTGVCGTVSVGNQKLWHNLKYRFKANLNSLFNVFGSCHYDIASFLFVFDAIRKAFTLANVISSQKSISQSMLTAKTARRTKLILIYLKSKNVQSSSSYYSTSISELEYLILSDFTSYVL